MLGELMAEAALTWLAGRPGVTAPVIGPRTMAQFVSALAAVRLTLGPELIAELDALFPGPGGPAPKAYAS
jgi:aryl-alcohol dehydrogenase-like predicted oxidoreductase